MPKVAGRGRRVKRAGHPAVAIPAVTWRRIERQLGVGKPDAALRVAIGAAVAHYRAEPRVPAGLYLDADDERPLSPDEVRDCAKELARAFRSLAQLGLPLPLPRGRETLLIRTLVRHWLSDHPAIAADPARRPLEPEELALLGERAARFRYRARSGPRQNVARDHLRWKLARAIEARCGEGKATFGWNEEHVEEHSKASGLLFHVLWTLRPWLPGLEDATPRRLYDAFISTRRRTRRQ